MNAESRQHLAAPKACDVKGPAVQILDHPFSFQRDFQEGGPQRPADMRSPLAPIQACAREPATQRTSCRDVDAKSLKRLPSPDGEVVRVVVVVRKGRKPR